MSQVNMSNTTPEKPKKSIGVIKRIVIMLGFQGFLGSIIVTAIVVSCLQNVESTSVQFLFWNIVEVPKLYLIAISTSLGVILGFILGLSLGCRISD